MPKEIRPQKGPDHHSVIRARTLRHDARAEPAPRVRGSPTKTLGATGKAQAPTTMAYHVPLAQLNLNPALVRYIRKHVRR